jgi:divalent metal cation (Fe/Co/Zn/Cd) transporter
MLGRSSQKNREIEDQIARFVEQKFDVNVDDVLIRPLGQAFSAQTHVGLDQNLTLKEAYEITKNKRCCVRKGWDRRNYCDSTSSLE